MKIRNLEDLKPGQRVRVTFEGTVNARSLSAPGSITVTPDVPSGRRPHAHIVRPNYDVELIEPEYEDGAMYVDADGDYWQHEVRDGRPGWLTTRSMAWYSPDCPQRPLRRLVPEAAE